MSKPSDAPRRPPIDPKWTDPRMLLWVQALEAALAHAYSDYPTESHAPQGVIGCAQCEAAEALLAQRPKEPCS